MTVDQVKIVAYEVYRNSGKSEDQAALAESALDALWSFAYCSS